MGPKSFKRKLGPAKKERKRTARADNILARSTENWPGAVTPGIATPARTSGPRIEGAVVVQGLPAPPQAKERIQALIKDLEGGKKVKGWTARNVSLALSRARARAAGTI